MTRSTCWVLGAGCWVLGAECWVLVLGAACGMLGAACGVLVRVRPGIAIACELLVGVRRYQDLECWQLANQLKREVYALVNNSPAKNDFKFRDQIFDSARSGPRNIAEGFGRYHHPEFIRFLTFGKASIDERHNHIGDGCDSGYWVAKERDRVQGLAERAAASTVGLIRYLLRSRAPTPR